MIYPIKLDRIDSAIEFYEEVIPLIDESKKYLENHSWCKKINEGWLFTNIGYAICIFLYDIENSQSQDDHLIWVVVGDLPPVYLDTNNVLSTREVLDNYVYLVDNWINHVESGESLDECFPLDSDMSIEAVSMLKDRIKLIKTSLLKNIEEIKYDER